MLLAAKYSFGSTVVFTATATVLLCGVVVSLMNHTTVSTTSCSMRMHTTQLMICITIIIASGCTQLCTGYILSSALVKYLYSGRQHLESFVNEDVTVGSWLMGVDR
jgi:hypothetical protein